MVYDHFNADSGLAMVRTDNQAFYRRVLLSETIAEPRRFPSCDTMKVVLMASDFPEGAREDPGAFSYHAIERFRAADAV
jgi:hypothetical protein